MAKVKTYWDEIKNKETHYYGGDMGWEVHLRYQVHHSFNIKTNEWEESRKLVWDWPFRAGDGISREEKSKTRKDVMFERARVKILAQASANKEEYRELMSRVGNKSEEEFYKIIGTMRGFELRNYISQTQWTDAESFAYFWRG